MVLRLYFEENYFYVNVKIKCNNFCKRIGI